MTAPALDGPLDLKESLRQRRDQLHLSNPELAELAGLPFSTVANYFSIRSKAASAYTVGKLCAALNFSLDRALASSRLRKTSPTPPGRSTLWSSSTPTKTARSAVCGTSPTSSGPMPPPGGFLILS